MGGINAQVATIRFGRQLRGHSNARSVLNWMALRSRDDHETPVYCAGGGELAALALGYEPGSKTGLNAVSTAIAKLRSIGAVSLRRHESPGRNAFYVVNVGRVHDRTSEIANALDDTGQSYPQANHRSRPTRDRSNPDPPNVPDSLGNDVPDSLGNDVPDSLGNPTQPNTMEHHQPRARVREEASEDEETAMVGGGEKSSDGGGDIHAVVGEIANTMAMGSGRHEAEDQEQPTSSSAARALLSRLRAQDGSALLPGARRQYESLVSRLLEQHAAETIADHLTAGIKQGGGIRYRLQQLADGSTTVGADRGSSPSSAPSSVEIPPVCGQCEGSDRLHFAERVIHDGGTLRKCQSCHPYAPVKAA